MGFSDRCPVPDGDGDIRFRTARGGRREISSVARAGVDSAHFPPTATPPRPGCPVFPGPVLSDQGVGQREKLVHGGARRVEPTDLAPVQRPTTER